LKIELRKKEELKSIKDIFFGSSAGNGIDNQRGKKSIFHILVLHEVKDDGF